MEDELAKAIGAKIVDRSSARDEHDEPVNEHAGREAERVPAETAAPERQREPEPEPEPPTG